MTHAIQYRDKLYSEAEINNAKWNFVFPETIKKGITQYFMLIYLKEKKTIASSQPIFQNKLSDTLSKDR